MKKLLFTACALLSLGLTIAQPVNRAAGMPFERRGHVTWRNVGMVKGNVELYKVQFITEKLNLTKSESELFWPVYNEHKKAVEAIINSKFNDEIQLEEALLTAKKKYKNDLKPILKSEDRINEALKVERTFLKTIRLEMMRRRGVGV